MKALPRQQLLLLDLQALDHTIVRLRRKPEQLPERAELGVLESMRGELRDVFLSAQREFDRLQIELGRIESDVQLVVDRRKRDDELLAASTSSKEAVAIQAELDTLHSRQMMLEERELEMMEQVETAEEELRAAESAYTRIDEDRSALLARIADADRAIAAELAAAEEERAGLAAEVRGDLLALYEETRGRVGIGAARLRGTVSEGSNMALTPAELSSIQAAADDEIVFCPGSGAILVRIADEENAAEREA